MQQRLEQRDRLAALRRLVPPESIALLRRGARDRASEHVLDIRQLRPRQVFPVLFVHTSGPQLRTIKVDELERSGHAHAADVSPLHIAVQDTSSMQVCVRLPDRLPENVRMAPPLAVTHWTQMLRRSDGLISSPASSNITHHT